MGTKLAPTYATLVMGYLELKLYDKIEEKFGTEFSKCFKEEWMRYLDDCFINWDTRIAEVTELLLTINNLNKGIKFTMDAHPTKNTFLQILLGVKNNKIITDIYYKPTDTFQFLPFTSCHPKHIKKNVLYNLARRICTIVDEKDTLDSRLLDLKEKLRRQKYPDQLINYGIEKAKSIPEEELRKTKKKPKNEEDIMTLITTHNPRNPNLLPTIKNTLPILSASIKLKNPIKRMKLINSKRQPSNLKRILTRARFVLKNSNPNDSKVTKCTNTSCGTCPYLQHNVNGIKFNHSGVCFKIKTKMTCEVKDVIYVVTCSWYGKQYIGETEDLRDRVTIHNQQINHPQYRHLNVSCHIARCVIRRRLKYKICPILKLRNHRGS